ncbi:MAG: adenylate/guanylate cyclase domain-containing protein [Oligoflexales bacterium]|nr:adenylate/guanylate cyclase domain-containing protein [Oligoflexales bacterium]
MQFKKNLIFRTIFILSVLLPAILCQTIVPIFSFEKWEGLSEKFYLYSLGFQKPPRVPGDALSSKDDEKKSKVAVIKVGKKSHERFGKEIPRTEFQALLTKLEENGNPHVLSLIDFEPLAKPLPKNVRVKRRELRLYKKQLEEDKRWALTVKSYRNFVSSGLSIHPDKTKPVLSEFEEQKLIPGMMIAKPGVETQQPNLIDLSVLENSQYLQASKAFGPRPYFAVKGSEYCYYPYHSIANESHVIPSSLIWATAFYGTRSFATWKGARWPRPGESRKAFKGLLKLAPQHCFATPSIDTPEFLKQREIVSYELADILSWENNPEFASIPLKRIIAGKIIILTRDHFGAPRPSDSPYIDMNYQELARSMDEFLNNLTIRRVPLSAYSTFSWMSLVIALFLIPLFFVASLSHIFLFNILIFIGISIFSILQLTHNREFMIPIQPLIFSMVSTITCFIYMVCMNTYINRRLDRFGARLRAKLSQALDLEDLKMGAQTVCASEYKVFKIFFLGFDADLYEAASNTKFAKEYLRKLLAEQPDIDKALFAPPSQFSGHQAFSTVMTTMKKLPKKDIKSFGEHTMNSKLAVAVEGVRLGTVDLHLVYEAFEEAFIPRMINILQHELSINWNRVENLSKRKLKDYFTINESAQKETAGKFLANVVLNKFDPTKSMIENLNESLMPRTCRVAMLQADIRGFERISEEHGSSKMMETLRLYYKNVVDAAQQIAQVKLIGDCIFLFIEENASPRSEVSHTDLAIHFAGLLVRESERLNETNPNAPHLEFSIAIHTGNVVVGNLSSDQSIDYTVVGENVNLVAKLQEISKIARVHEQIGMNAILLTAEAKADLRLFSMAKLPVLNLEEVNVKVRSFPDIKSVHFATKEVAVKVANQATVKRMINPDLPLSA